MAGKTRIRFAWLLLIFSAATLALAAYEYRRAGNACQLLYTRSVKEHDIVETARKAFSALNDSEIRAQNYVLTGETVYSEAYAEDLRNWQDEYGALELVAIHDPAASIVKDFSQAGTRTLNELAAVISLYEKTGREAALDRIRKGSGIVYLDQARSVLAMIEDVDRAESADAERIVRVSLSAFRWLMVGAVLLFLFVVVGAILQLLGKHRTVSSEEVAQLPRGMDPEY